MKKNKGPLLGVPVVGARSRKELRKRKFKPKTDKKSGSVGVKATGKKKNGNNDRKEFSLFDSYGKKSNAKEMGKKLKKTGSDTRLLKRTVRTKGRGPKLETEYLLYSD